MILCDRDIAEYIEKHRMVVGADPSQINPASLDVRLGRYIIIETPEGSIKRDLIEDGPYKVSPKEFVLAHTQEMFYLPDGHGACKQAISIDFKLKSSPARSGLQHLKAGFGDPGWHDSTMTLEFVNVSRYHEIEFYYGRRVGQVVFMKTGTPDRSYAETGRYNNDAIVTESKGW